MDLEMYEEDLDFEDVFEECVVELRDKWSGVDDYDDDFFVVQLGMQKMLDVIQLYFNEIGFLSLLILEEEVYYVCCVLCGFEDVCKCMIESNLWLVVKIVWRYVNCGLLLLDLIEEGNLGLIWVVEKFDFEWGFCFLIYVIWWIR